MAEVSKKLKENHKKIIPFIPDEAFYFSKGIEAFQNRNFDLAIKWMKKAMDINPKEPLYPCQMSIIYTEIGSYHASNQLLTNVLRNTDYVDCYYLLANNYAHLGLLNDAKKYVKLYLEKDPNGEFEEDAKRLLHVIEIDEEEEDIELEAEDDLLIYQETVFYHLENNEWEQAIPVIEEMMEIFPDYKMAKHDYAQALFFSDDKQKAIDLELSILAEDPNDLYSLTNLALFYYEIEDNKKAKPYIETIKKVFPIHEQQKLRLAVTLARTENYEAANIRFRKLLKEVVKSHPSYYRWFSITAYQIGQPKKALECWKEGCRRHPKLAEEQGPWNK